MAAAAINAIEPPFWPVTVEQGIALDRCNDCGVLVYVGDELCGACFKQQIDCEFWESLEERWPPRE